MGGGNWTFATGFKPLEFWGILLSKPVHFPFWDGDDRPINGSELNIHQLLITLQTLQGIPTLEFFGQLWGDGWTGLEHDHWMFGPMISLTQWTHLVRQRFLWKGHQPEVRGRRPRQHQQGRVGDQWGVHSHGHETCMRNKYLFDYLRIEYHTIS